MRHATRPEVLAAVQACLAGSPDARDRLLAAWDSLPADDAFHRCVVAHHLADLAPTAAEALAWDTRALAAASPEAAPEFEDRFPGMSHRRFLPSLHLNLAASHERAGDLPAARRHAAAAALACAALPDDAASRHTRAGVARLQARLAEPG